MLMVTAGLETLAIEDNTLAIEDAGASASGSASASASASAN